MLLLTKVISVRSVRSLAGQVSSMNLFSYILCTVQMQRTANIVKIQCFIYSP